ncbi:MAG: zinc ribbon domain-containing protein [Gammaproteobacteria bacterium]|nr:zinc ribbon domain-containing protein [Gammaproteobacteria bacterium]
MFCEQCGAELEQDARFCGMCGSRLQVEKENPPNSQRAKSPGVPLQQGGESRARPNPTFATGPSKPSISRARRA